MHMCLCAYIIYLYMPVCVHDVLVCLQEQKNAIKTSTVKEFLSEVQATLSDEGFQKFKYCMVNYSKVSVTARSV